MLPHHVGLVEHPRDLACRVGDVVEGDPAVLVDGDAEDAALAGGGDLDGLDVEAHRLQGVDQLRLDAVPGGVLLWRCSRVATSLCSCPGTTIAGRDPGRHNTRGRSGPDHAAARVARCPDAR